MRPEAAERGMTRPLKPIPLFEQGPGESDGRFLRRVEKLTKVGVLQSSVGAHPVTRRRARSLLLAGRVGSRKSRITVTS